MKILNIKLDERTRKVKRMKYAFKVVVTLAIFIVPCVLAYVNYDPTPRVEAQGSEVQVVDTQPEVQTTPDAPQEVVVAQEVVVSAEVVNDRYTRMYDFLRSFNSPYVDYANYLVDISDKYNTDPFVLVSIMGTESSMGKACMGYNCWGWLDGYKAGSFEDQVEHILAGFSQRYSSCGSDFQCIANRGYNQEGGNWVQDSTWFYQQSTKFIAD